MKEVRWHLKIFVEQDHHRGEKAPPKSNQRFYPSKNTIRSYIYKAVIRERFSKFDQENLQKKVELWQSKCPDETFLFRPLVHYSEETNCAEDEDSEDNEEEGDNENILPKSTDGQLFVHMINRNLFVMKQIQLFCIFLNRLPDLYLWFSQRTGLGKVAWKNQ